MTMQRTKLGHLLTALTMAVTLGVAPLVVGCGSSSGGTTASYDSGATTEEYTGSSAELSADTVNEAAAESKESDSVVIKSAYVSLQTRSYDDALTAIKQIISNADGNITNSRESGGYSRSITIEARVDPSKLEAMVEELRKLDGCTVISANISADDVTRTYNDTERRIEILNEQYEHYKQMLEAATTTEDMLEISDRMYDVMAEIKSYTDARDDMKHDADRSLISVTLDEEVAAGESSTTSSPGDFAADAWDDSWGVFGQVVRSLIYVLIMLLPYLLVAAVIVGIVLLIRRSRRRRKKDIKDSGQPKSDVPETAAPTTDNAPNEVPETKDPKDQGPRPPQW